MCSVAGLTELPESLRIGLAALLEYRSKYHKIGALRLCSRNFLD